MSIFSKTGNETRLIVALVSFFLILVFFMWVCGPMNRLPKQTVDKIYDIEHGINQPKTDTVRNSRGQMVTTQDVVKLERHYQASVNRLADSIFSLNRRLNGTTVALIQLQQNISAKPIKIPLSPPVSKPRDTTKPNNPNEPPYFEPRTFEYQDSTIMIAGVIGPDSIDITQVKIPNTITIRTEEIRYGLFKTRKKLQIQAINSSPLFEVDKITNYTVKQRPNFWNRIGKPVLITVGAGFVGYKMGKSN